MTSHIPNTIGSKPSSKPIKIKLPSTLPRYANIYNILKLK